MHPKLRHPGSPSTFSSSRGQLIGNTQNVRMFSPVPAKENYPLAFPGESSSASRPPSPSTCTAVNKHQALPRFFLPVKELIEKLPWQVDCISSQMTFCSVRAGKEHSDWMNPGNVMLSDINQTQKHKDCTILLT